MPPLKILVRILFACLSGYSLFFLATVIRLPIPDLLWLGLLLFWFFGLVILGGDALLKKQSSFPRLLKHVLYGPFSVFLVFVIATLTIDWAMIQYSKYEIRSYVHGDTPSEIEINFDLHNDYRGWCGNGYPSREYSLYADTAAEGFLSVDPAVRARSLRASIEVYDWLNGVRDGPFTQIIRQAENDPDPTVRGIAAKFNKSRVSR